jgi:hypothetical protein
MFLILSRITSLVNRSYSILQGDTLDRNTACRYLHPFASSLRQACLSRPDRPRLVLPLSPHRLHGSILRRISVPRSHRPSGNRTNNSVTARRASLKHANIISHPGRITSPATAHLGLPGMAERRNKSSITNSNRITHRSQSKAERTR